jgi:hypothetical protein
MSDRLSPGTISDEGDAPFTVVPAAIKLARAIPRPQPCAKIAAGRKLSAGVVFVNQETGSFLLAQSCSFEPVEFPCYHSDIPYFGAFLLGYLGGHYEDSDECSCVNTAAREVSEETLGVIPHDWLREQLWKRGVAVSLREAKVGTHTVHTSVSALRPSDVLVHFYLSVPGALIQTWIDAFHARRLALFREICPDAELVTTTLKCDTNIHGLSADIQACHIRGIDDDIMDAGAVEAFKHSHNQEIMTLVQVPRRWVPTEFVPVGLGPELNSFTDFVTRRHMVLNTWRSLTAFIQYDTEMRCMNWNDCVVQGNQIEDPPNRYAAIDPPLWNVAPCNRVDQ